MWLWPVPFVGVMLVGGALGMSHVALPFVEPAILASVVALGLLVALAVDLPVAVGAAIIGAFALFHGHAHGSEVAENIGGFEYMAGFAIATATLHLTGIGFAQLMTRAHMRPAIRVAGALCVVARAAGSVSQGTSNLRMIPGEMFIQDGEIELNKGRKTVTVSVANSATGRSRSARIITSSKPMPA